MQNKLLLLIPILTLAGCACFKSPEPEVRVVTQKVEIPIATPCKEEAPPAPDYCFLKLDENADIFEKVKCLLSDRKLSAAYEIELNSKLNACK